MTAIGLDFDDVIYPWFDTAHLLSSYAGITNGIAPTSWAPYEDYGCTMQAWHDVLSDGAITGALYRADPIPGAIEAMHQLKAAGHTLHIVTARGLLTNGHLIQKHTVDYILDRGIPHDSLTFSKDKTIASVRWFLDDNIDNVRSFRPFASTTPVLVVKPWNRGQEWWGHEVDSLADFADKFKTVL